MDGITMFSHLVGLMGQRLWFYRKTQDYTDKLKIVLSVDCVFLYAL